MPEPSSPKRSRRGPQTDGVTPPAAAETQDAAARVAKRRGNRTAWPETPHRESAENSISIDRPRDRGSPGSTPPDSPRDEGSRGASRFDPESVLTESVRAKYTQVGSRFHFPDSGEQAFRVSATRTTTRSVDPGVIRDILEFEAARAGTERLRVRGSVEFRAEAWRQAQLAGIEVRGYRPSELERAQVARSIESRRRSRAQGAAELRPSDTAGREQPTPPADSVTRKSPPREQSVDPGSRSLQGRLVEHGAARYQHNPNEDMSYYIKVETRSGEQTLWGKDFERAIKESLSHVKVGDRVGINHAGETAVTVKARRRDEDGNYTRREEVAAVKNRWLVERQDFLQEREELARVVRDPSVSPLQAIQQYPNLEGTYAELHAAKLMGRDNYKHSVDAERFVTRFRNELANEIARGESLPAVRIREQSTAEASKRRDRDPPDRQPERVLS